MTDTPAPTDAPTGSGAVAQSQQSTAAQVRQDAASVRDTATELSALVVAYAKQETLEPVRQLGRYVLFGVLGSVFVAVGVFFLALAAIRVLQTEASPHLAHNLSWVPYMGGVIVAGLAAGLAAMRIMKVPNGKGGRK